MSATHQPSPSVWAPWATRVELVLNGEAVPMRPGSRSPHGTPGCGHLGSGASAWGAVPGPAGGPAEAEPPDDGWWVADPEGWEAGAEYAFRLDGEGPFPDPRSPWQPHGVHGPSRVVDHNAFPWSDQNFRAPPLASGLVYELHVGTFSPEGTFAGAVDRLGHLEELGVTHVELMPVAAFPGSRGWGYDGVGLYAVHEPYGGPEGLKAFVDACHARGMAVILDVVYNHLGPEGNYLHAFGPYFTDRYATPWGEAVNYDGAGSHEVRRLAVDNALMWFRDYHVDALRLDAVHAILDRSALHVLEEMARDLRALEAQEDRPLVLVAESDLNDPVLVTPAEAGGYGLDAQWSDDFHHALHALLTGEDQGYYGDFGSLAHLARALERGYVYEGGYSGFRRRRHGRPFTSRRGDRLLGYVQNHDQVGNRAVGDRIGETIGPEGVKVAAALVLTSPFVPLLFQGEEWAASTPFLYFTDLGDEGLGEAVRKGRRAEFADFGWDPGSIPDPQAVETFERSRLDWRERELQPHAEVLGWYRRLVDLRRRVPALRDGRMARVRYDDRERWIQVERGPVTVAANVGGEARRVPLPEGWTGEVLLASTDAVVVDGGSVELPPGSVGILGPSGLASPL